MAANSKLTLTSLDFDALKSSLKSYLQSQSQFTDYDFEGAGINVLLDLLAYNTHYNAFYLNMVANEMFLDTAVLRQTVVSHAKSLGYTPRSATAALATVNVAITRSATDNTSVLILPRFTAFASDSLNGVSYTFLTLDDAVATATGGVFNYTNVLLSEGTPTIKTFLADSTTNPTQTFDIVDANVDTASIQVIVQKSLTNIQQTRWTLATDATEVSSTSNVFYLQEGTNGNYQFYFGDGIIGSKLDDGNIVVVSYVVTNADAANSLQNFKLVSNPLSGGTSNTITVAASAGGSGMEDVASIKFVAPKAYVAQNRAVTKNDYIALINKNYPYFDAVNIWGGEEEIPPQYGRVFISAKPKNGYVITEAQKQYVITNIIEPISILTVTPQFVDPDYTYLRFELEVEYDSNQTTSSTGQIESVITAAVQNYGNNNLNTFNSEFRLSRMLRAIDDSDPSILSSSATIKLEKRFTPTLNANSTYTLSFGVPLYRGSLNDRLYSTPAFNILDGGGIVRSSYIEETPGSYSGVNQINIVNAGYGFISAPQLAITGDGTGANAYCTIVNGKISSITIDNPGYNYTTAICSVVGTSVSPATLTVSLQGKSSILRTYYFDNNNNKIILNNNAGIVDYNNGIITLTNFAPIGVNNSEGSLNLVIQADVKLFASTKSNILTIDPNDQNAILISLIDVKN